MLPAEPPSLPNIIINELAIPRYLVGNKFTPTAKTIFELEQQLRNITKLSTVKLNSAKMFNAIQPIADKINQTPKMEKYISYFTYKAYEGAFQFTKNNFWLHFFH